MSSSARRVPTSRLLPLFLVCLCSIGYEIALTRFFAIASWSEYGYWVISMTMVGLAASGIVASLAQRFLVRHITVLLPLLPILMLVAATAGWHWTTLVPFNPLELQNRQLWDAQLLNIGQFYAALFPFFFLVGLYVTLYFVLYNDEIGRVYAFDLAGAGLGAALGLALMFVVPPFHLVACLIPALLVAAFLEISPQLPRRTVRIAAVGVFVLCEASLLLFNQARVNEYKEIFPPMNTEGSRIVASRLSPKGQYLLLDNFTERLDTDISNNASMLGGAELPRAYGLYADGNRIAAVPRASMVDTAYFGAALDSLPYRLRPGARTLLVGAAGGFRIHEALNAGAARIDALEPDVVLRGALLEGMGPAPPLLGRPNLAVLGTSPLAVGALGEGPTYDIIDITREFLGQSDTNRAALSVETLGAYVGLLKPGGMLSLPVSIREFTVYAVKTFATARAALRQAGAREPGRHLVIYRSAFNVRLLLSAEPWTDAALETVRRFCDERSFDLVYLAGRDIAGATVYNQLPVVSFDINEAPSAEPGPDAMRREADAAVAGEPSPFHGFFRLRPPTLDRPFFNAVLPLWRIGAILDRVELVPREELVWLVNIAVLAQALVIALIVALLPLRKRAAAGVSWTQFLKSLAYFAGLGLGFLMLEIYLIEKAAYYLHDRTFAFGLILATMLISSGVGSQMAQWYRARPRMGLALSVLAILVWCELAFVWLDVLLGATATQPLAAKVAILILVSAPVSVALGMPMSLGLSQFDGRRLGLLPWAWAMNGACSVIATPLANLLATAEGFRILLVTAIFLYVAVFLCLPISRR